MSYKQFNTRSGKSLLTPIFFPDATRGVIRTLDSRDIQETKTEGILVNTYHLYFDIDEKVINQHGNIRKLIKWDGAVISDSGGFQVMSIVKKTDEGKITDKGIHLKPPNKKGVIFTPEMSIKSQLALETDLLVVLDDFTERDSSKESAKETVERTIKWAKRSKKKFEEECKKRELPENQRPYLIGVVQGGEYMDLRKECTERLIDIGFDGLGYGGWPIKESGDFNYEVAELISEITPDDYFLYALGIGKPKDIVGMVKRGWHLFDCVLPTRDARHGRLYVYNADSIERINVTKDNFYSFLYPKKQKHLKETGPISKACDCRVCKEYSLGYLSHLFRVGDITAMRLATIHNLRFYSILMEKLKK